jgi:hypothetical protein
LLKDTPQVGNLSPKDFHPQSQRLSRFSHFRKSGLHVGCADAPLAVERVESGQLNRGIDFTDSNTGERYEISIWAQLINKINKYVGNFVFVATD